jgi:hypothetical protein
MKPTNPNKKGEINMKTLEDNIREICTYQSLKLIAISTEKTYSTTQKQ